MGVRLHTALAAIYILIAIAYIGTSEGLVDRAGFLIGRDFVNFWTAGTLAARGQVLELFDVSAYVALQRQLVGFALPVHNWSYPPHALFIAVPLALASYPWSLALWSGTTVVAYALASGRAVLLVAPATFASLFFGQTGCLVGALFIGGLRLLPTRPGLAGILFGLMTIKPHLGLLVPVALIAAGAWRGAASAVAVSSALVVASGLVFGWDAWRTYLEVTTGVQGRILTEGAGTFLTMMPSAFIAGRLLELGTGLSLVIQVPFSLLAVGVVFWAFRPHRGGPLAAAILLLAAVIATPYVFIYDLAGAAYAVLLLEGHGQREGFRFGERLSYGILWLLPLVLIPLNKFSCLSDRSS